MKTMGTLKNFDPHIFEGPDPQDHPVLPIDIRRLAMTNGKERIQLQMRHGTYLVEAELKRRHDKRPDREFTEEVTYVASLRVTEFRSGGSRPMVNIESFPHWAHTLAWEEMLDTAIQLGVVKADAEATTRAMAEIDNSLPLGERCCS